MLRINTEFRKGVFFIRLTGKIENNNYLESIDVIRENIGIRYIVLNIENIEFVDINTINHIIDYNNKLLKNKGCLLICDKNQNRNRLFKKIKKINCEIEAFSLI